MERRNYKNEHCFCNSLGENYLEKEELHLWSLETFANDFLQFIIFFLSQRVRSYVPVIRPVPNLVLFCKWSTPTRDLSFWVWTRLGAGRRPTQPHLATPYCNQVVHHHATYRHTLGCFWEVEYGVHSIFDWYFVGRFLHWMIQVLFCQK